MIRLLVVIASLAILTILSSIPDNARAGSQSSGPSPRAQFELEPVLEGLDQPVFVTGARDRTNRLFIVERPGRIKVLSPDGGLPKLFLDITQEVKTAGENGLLGLAFHPQYIDNRRLFVCYSRGTDGATVIAEYRASETDPDSAGPDERLLLEIPQPSDVHHGGMIEFGPDNLLYISTGDGEWEDPENSAQSVESLRGKILRIDVDRADGESPYASPPTNPFFGEIPGSDEIFALGFRNPWRFAFDRETGQLFVGDVGHAEREEINVVAPGGNYGWRVFEGTGCTNLDPALCESLNVIPPLLEYGHTDGRCSVIGGYVYRGATSSLPVGAYVFADFCSGEILQLDGGAQQLVLDTDLRIVSLGEDDSGEIYVVGLNGTVDRIAKGALEEEPRLRIDSVEIRHHSKGTLLDPITVKQNGKKYDVVIRGSGLEPGVTVFVNGRDMKTVTTSGTEVVARLRIGTLSEPGVLVIAVTNLDGLRSEDFPIEVQ